MKHPSKPLMIWALVFEILFLALIGGGVVVVFVGVIELVHGSSPEVIGAGTGILLASLFFRFCSLITSAVAIAAKNKHI